MLSISIESPLDLSLPLVIPQPSTLLKNTTMCNSTNPNITNEATFNEDRNSVTCSEDSGISSSSGDDVSALANIKYNRSGPSPSRLISGLYFLNTKNPIESRSRVLDSRNHLNTKKCDVIQTIRPNSTSSDVSTLSDTEQSDVVTRLGLPEEKISTSNHVVSKTIN